MRLDQYLVFKKLVSSRSRAKDLILSGHVQVASSGEAKVVESPSFDVPEDENIQIFINQNHLRYVSRAGLKLEGALKYVKKDVQGLVALDVGISTGGFADCLLQKGASQVVGVDVGHDQLHESLKNEERLLSFEGVNARTLSQEERFSKYHGQIDLVVVDVSFISIKYILPEVVPFLKSQGEMLALVKPQFEVGQKELSKKGLVKDKASYINVKKQICDGLKKLNFNVIDYFDSPIKGKSGNKEFFIYAVKSSG